MANLCTMKVWIAEISIHAVVGEADDEAPEESPAERRAKLKASQEAFKAAADRRNSGKVPPYQLNIIE